MIFFRLSRLCFRLSSFSPHCCRLYIQPLLRPLFSRRPRAPPPVAALPFFCNVAVRSPLVSSPSALPQSRRPNRAERGKPRIALRLNAARPERGSRSTRSVGKASSSRAGLAVECALFRSHPPQPSWEGQLGRRHICEAWNACESSRALSRMCFIAVGGKLCSAGVSTTNTTRLGERRKSDKLCRSPE